MKNSALLLLLLIFSSFSMADTNKYRSDRELLFKDVFMERIDINSRMMDSDFGLKIYKICLDGQAYLALNHDRSQSLTASFKDGKPEQCTINRK